MKKLSALPRKVKEKARDALIRLHKFREERKIERVSGNGYAFGFSSGHEVFNPEKACYSSLGGSILIDQEKGRDSVMTYFVSMVFNMSDVYKKDEHIKFLNWVLNDSPWADCFHTKCGVEAYSLGVICNITSPANKLIGGLSAIREVNEFAVVVKGWDFLVSLGVHPDMAYLISYYFDGVSRHEKGMDYKFDNFKMRAHSDAHQPLHPVCMDKHALRNYFNHTPDKSQTKKLLNISMTYAGITDLRGSGAQYRSAPCLMFRDITKYGVEGNAYDWGEEVKVYNISTKESKAILVKSLNNFRKKSMRKERKEKSDGK